MKSVGVHDDKGTRRRRATRVLCGSHRAGDVFCGRAVSMSLNAGALVAYRHLGVLVWNRREERRHCLSADQNSAGTEERGPF